jgi:hypothetical protein
MPKYIINFKRCILERYTLTEAQQFYDVAKKAYLNALTNKSYDTTNRSKSNQNIADLKKDMDYWADIVWKLKSGKTTGRTVKRAIPYV